MSHTQRRYSWLTFVLLFAASLWLPLSSAKQTSAAETSNARKVFRGGAFAIDVTPLKLPVIVNGSMRERLIDKVTDRLHARCLVLDDGKNKIAIAVVDNCMIPRHLLDQAKERASQATGIPTNRILISATHAHSAPSVQGCLGSDADQDYSRFLPLQIAKGIAFANKNLEPARIGWAVGKDDKNVHIRRFEMKPGTAATGLFTGTTNDRAQMNPGYQNPNAIRRTGVADTDVTIVSIQALDGRPLAILGNYSTHYAGAPNISADYFGVFARRIGELIGADKSNPNFVGIMSNGTSGDANCLDFTRSARKFDRFTVGEDVAQAGFEAYQRIKYFDWAPIVMEERLMTFKVRMADAEEVAAAKDYLAKYKGRKPQERNEIYARETVILSQMPPTRELKLQAIRIGSLGITTIPNEVYAETGLTLKKKSPLETTFTIELANGCEGYLPPPEQHKLGGYTTWRARTSCLELQAEPKIVSTLLEMLKQSKAARDDEKAVASK